MAAKKTMTFRLVEDDISLMRKIQEHYQCNQTAAFRNALRVTVDAIQSDTQEQHESSTEAVPEHYLSILERQLDEKDAQIRHLQAQNSALIMGNRALNNPEPEPETVEVVEVESDAEIHEVQILNLEDFILI